MSATSRGVKAKKRQRQRDDERKNAEDLPRTTNDTLERLGCDVFNAESVMLSLQRLQSRGAAYREPRVDGKAKSSPCNLRNGRSSNCADDLVNNRVGSNALDVSNMKLYNCNGSSMQQGWVKEWKASSMMSMRHRQLGEPWAFQRIDQWLPKGYSG